MPRARMVSKTKIKSGARGSARTAGTGSAVEPGVRRESEFEKVGVTMPKQVAREARERVREGGAQSLSAYVSQAVREKLERDDLTSMLEEMDAEYGPVSAERLQWADGVIDRLLARD